MSFNNNNAVMPSIKGYNCRLYIQTMGFIFFIFTAIYDPTKLYITTIMTTIIIIILIY